MLARKGCGARGSQRKHIRSGYDRSDFSLQSTLTPIMTGSPRAYGAHGHTSLINRRGPRGFVCIVTSTITGRRYVEPSTQNFIVIDRSQLCKSHGLMAMRRLLWGSEPSSKS